VHCLLWDKKRHACHSCQRSVCMCAWCSGCEGAHVCCRETCCLRELWNGKTTSMPSPICLYAVVSTEWGRGMKGSFTCAPLLACGLPGLLCVTKPSCRGSGVCCNSKSCYILCCTPETGPVDVVPANRWMHGAQSCDAEMHAKGTRCCKLLYALHIV